jgi:hypothetical protein
MPDIFGRTPLSFGGAFAADSAAMTFTGFANNLLSAVGTLAQNMQVTYQQPIIRLYELGDLYEYFVVGRPQGNGTFNRVIGPRPMLYAFYTTFGDACNALNNNIEILCETACGDILGDFMQFDLYHCVLTTYGLSVSAQDMVFNETLPFMFVSLQVPDS